jgi:CubicO group peptidase (beta-lactamase class C family)
MNIAFAKFIYILSCSVFMLSTAVAEEYKMKNYLTDRDYPDSFWQKSTPKKEGMSEKILSNALKHIQNNQLEIHSFLIIKNGKLVFDYYGQEKTDKGFVQRTPADLHELHSVTKTLTSTLLGIAIDKGAISGVDAKAVDFFKATDLKNIDARKTAITLKNLLTMQSGLEYTEGKDDTLFFDFSAPVSALSLINKPMVATPGTTWNYSSGNSQIIAAILRNVTQKRP